MPLTVDEERLKGKAFFRDGIEVRPLIEMKVNEPPTIPIPHNEYPRVVYQHPNEPYTDIEHRNDKFEVVGTERVPTEHRAKLVQNEVELKKALAEGWVKEPYLPKAVEDPKAHLYAKKKPA